MKRITALVLCIIMALSLSACSGKKGTSDNYTMNIAALKGATSIGLAKLFSDGDYNYNIYGTADEISTGLINGSLDAAAVPCNLASVLYNKTNGEIVIAGINTLGVLYIVEKGETLNTVADLKGKTIYSTGQGTTPEYTLRHMLSINGIDPDKDVTIEFKSEASEIVSQISTLDNAIAMLPQPYVTVATSKDENIKVAFDVTEEWKKTDKDSEVVTGVLVARKTFITDHKDVFKKFLQEYSESTDFANTNTDECADLLEKLDIFKAAIAKKAIPECNVTFITGDDMKVKVLSYLNVLYDLDKKSIGGTLPDYNLFYTE